MPLRTYSTSDGLAHYSVSRIVRDSRGFLWFCTRDGLSRFDGYEFISYRSEDGLPSAAVVQLLETRDGVYWIGTLDGLVRFEPSARSSFTTYRPGEERAATITSLAQDRAGSVWIGTAGGLFRATTERGQTRFTALELGIADRLFARTIQALLADRSGALWIAAGTGIYVRNPSGELSAIFRADGLPLATVDALLEDSHGRIWAATTAGVWQLARDERGKPRVIRVLSTREGLPSDWATAVFEGSDSSVWVATTNGLAHIDAPDGGDVRATPFGPSRGVPAVNITAIEEDTNGNLWLGTNADGVMRLTRNGFTMYGAEDGISAANSAVRARGGELAFIAGGADDWAIACSAGDKFIRVKPRADLGGRSWAWNQALLQDSAGEWWLGTTKGVFRFAPASCAGLAGALPIAHYDSRSGLAADIVIRLFEDSRHDVWIATAGHGLRPDGLSRWSRRTGTVQAFSEHDGLPTFERHYVSALAEDRSGNLWIGFSRDGGLARYRGGRFTRFARAEGVPAGLVRDIVVDRAGHLWAASYRGGLLRVDNPGAEQPAFRAYTVSDGLASNETHALLEDDRGRLYIGSARGLDLLDPDNGRITRYSVADGLPAAELNAAIRDSTGHYWLLYTVGLVRFRPDSGRPAPDLRVWIAGVSVEGEPQPISPLGETDVAPVRLPHTRDSLQVTFLALGASGDFEYRYKLENASDWTPFSRQRSVNFAHLAPGGYRLLVQAQDSRGVFSGRPATFAFTIVPPLWQRRPVIAAAAAALLIAAYAFHRYRTSRLLDIARIRDRIAADLHDDLGANLTKIAVLGEVARQQGARSDAALASIAAVARESAATMNDIVWAVDPGRDTLDDLIRKIRQHATETFALGDVDLTFNAPRSAGERPMTIGLRHDVFLIYKEILNNAARHSRCRRVTVDVRCEGGALLVRVSDDGIGFDPASEAAGRGLRSMRARAARLGAALTVESRQGGGTIVTLRMPPA